MRLPRPWRPPHPPGWRAGLLLLRLLLAAWGATATAAGAENQALPDLQAPFSPGSVRDEAGREANGLWLQTLAERAVEAGFYPVAEGFFREALKPEGLEPERRRRLVLGLATALVAQSKPAAALEALESVASGRGPAWLLRRAVVDFLRADFPALEQRLRQLQPDDLSRADAGWFFFLRARASERAGDPGRAETAFEEALARTTSSAEVAVFRLARIQAQLSAGEATEGLAAQLRRLVDDNQGRLIGYRATLRYAVVLDKLGRTREAIAILNRQRSTLPPEETAFRDQTLLLLGLIAGADTGEGRAALRELLIQGSDRAWQQAALQRLAAGVPAEGGSPAAALRQLCDELLARTPPHPLYEDLLFYRAELALRNRDFERAEQDIDTLLTRFPGTELRRHALALLANSSWQSERYRSAANYVAQLRDGLDPGPERAALAVLLGECYYRAGMQTDSLEDFRNAAEAYGAAQSEIAGARGVGAALGVSPGTLFFQRVLATIRSGNPDGAARLLDDPAFSGAVDAESRWQAEWNLVRFLQLQQRGADAFKRVEALGQAAGAPPGMRLRFLWLAAQLSLDVGLAGDTAGRVARVMEFLAGDDGRQIDPAVRSAVASSTALLAAQARLETGDTEGGMKALEALRTEYPGSRAALYSFIVQARYLATENKLVEAQRLLTNLADTYRQSDYAPLALYEAALQAERRGQDTFLNEANQLLERLAVEYPQEQHQFPARLKQADIARRLNRFAAAEQIYQYLENTFPNHPERAFVQLSLADTLLAQAATDRAKFEGAISRLERLAVLPTARLDLRAEAGFKLAHAWQVQGNAERATQLYWEVYQRFLGDPGRAGQLGARGRYWLARTLLELGQLEESASRLDNARRAYEAVLAHGLPGEKLARGRLGRFQTGGSG